MPHLTELAALVDRLVRPDGCPWDRAQTWSSMRPYLLEECHEVLDALDAGDPDAVTGELGDLLFVVLLMARIGQDTPGAGGIEEVARRIRDKMVRRHPHVFADEARPDGPGIEHWEAQKAQEAAPGGPPRSRLAGVPRALPALLRTHRQSEKAASVGFDWPDAAGVLAKVEEELAELRDALRAGDDAGIAHEYGDVLMALGSLGRHIGAPPESALRQANDRFAARFQAMEAAAFAQGVALDDLDDAQLDALWEAAKQAAPSQPSAGA